MPTAATIRTLAFGLLAMLAAGGLYLWAVRGQALLLDLATGVRGFLCL
ncbi:MAG: hypothetical protein R3D27_11160 [Hyphomicrobiaceae bacterium]